MEITWECELKRKDYAIEQLQNWKETTQQKIIEIAPKPQPKPKPKPKKQESPEVLKKLETSDKHDAVYTAYNHVYGINM